MVGVALTLGVVSAGATVVLLRGSLVPGRLIGDAPGQVVAAPEMRAVPSRDGPPLRAPSVLPDSILQGTAAVTDGDTIVISGQRIRLFGVDAPEARQICVRSGTPYPCGELATKALAALLAEGKVRCEARDLDRYGRTVARCMRDDDTDLAAEMVEQGWAVAFRRYSSDYIDAEDRARAAGKGIWAGSFDDPSIVRQRR